MKDQHTKIKGYRDLSQVESDLMNAVKSKAEEVKELIDQVNEYLCVQHRIAYEDGVHSRD